MTAGVEAPESGAVGVAPSASAPLAASLAAAARAALATPHAAGGPERKRTTAPDAPHAPQAAALAPGRLNRLAKTIASQLRRDFLTPTEASSVWRRARALAGIQGRPRKASRLPDILTPTELRAVLAEAYRARPRDGLVIRLLFESAIRVAELSRLDVADMDLAERTVRVRQGKGGKDRLALIGGDLAQLLRVHLGDRSRGPLLVSSRGTRLSVRRIQSLVREAARRAGVEHKRISPHTFRHTWATLARNAGLPLDTVQGLLGHANPRTTELYSRLAIGRAREEYDAAMRAIHAGDVRPTGTIARERDTE